MTKERNRFHALAEELEDKLESKPATIIVETDETDYDDEPLVAVEVPLTVDVKFSEERPKVYLSARGRIFPVEKSEITSVELGMYGREAYQPFYGWSDAQRAQRYEIELRVPEMLRRAELGEENESVLVINEKRGSFYFRLLITSVKNTMTAAGRGHTDITAISNEMIR